MSFMIGAVALVGLLCALDLVLTVGVIKRLSEHTKLLNDVNEGPAIGVGAEIGDFAAVTMDGERLSRESLVGQTLVAFFSPTCGPCKEKLPKFVEFARTMQGGRARVLAVVVGDADQARQQVAELSPVARVVVEDTGSTLSSAFAVKAYPTVLMIAPNGDGKPAVIEDEVSLDRQVPASV